MYLDTMQETTLGHEPVQESACFTEFSEATQIGFKTQSRMGPYQFYLVPCKGTKSLIMQVVRNEELIIATHLPSVFSRGELASASLRIRGCEYLVFAAHTTTRAGSNAKHWFAIFSADGKKIYVSSPDQRVARARPHEDGVSLFFANGDSMRIKL